MWCNKDDIRVGSYHAGDDGFCGSLHADHLHPICGIWHRLLSHFEVSLLFGYAVQKHPFA